MSALPEQQSPPRVVICGVKNSGKTTLIVSLLKRFAGMGLRVAVIKHDGHDFSCDVPGTDSFACSEAGAYGVSVFSANRIFVHKTGTGETEEELANFFPEADLILIEGLKDSPYPKIELVRRGISDLPASEARGRFLIVTDLEQEERKGDAFGDTGICSFRDTEEIASRILEAAHITL